MNKAVLRVEPFVEPFPTQKRGPSWWVNFLPNSQVPHLRWPKTAGVQTIKKCCAIKNAVPDRYITLYHIISYCILFYFYIILYYITCYIIYSIKTYFRTFEFERNTHLHLPKRTISCQLPRPAFSRCFASSPRTRPSKLASYWTKMANSA